MLNLALVTKVYIASGYTDLRKSINGLSSIVTHQLKMDPFENALFVFCNRQRNRLKILHFDEGFWLYYYRLENGCLKWPKDEAEALMVTKQDLEWLLKGYELRIHSKFDAIKGKNHY
ncbi:MAG: IS66 family insertion sequence element accessory protein TnpB [Vallitaleaceae bacterium]|jgi:transposase|nr:IS66 family insertion sequence element accessory protein TnpB [Vallitaleaceae bacterium]